MENSFYSPTFLIYKEVCVLRAVTWVLGSSHNLKDRCLSCQRVESPLEDLQLAVEDSGLCTPLLITHWLKLVTWPQHHGRGQKCPSCPARLSSALCSGQPPWQPYQCKPQSAPLLSGTFLACPFPLPDRVGPACSKAPGVHRQYSTSITWFREMDESICLLLASEDFKDLLSYPQLWTQCPAH